MNENKSTTKTKPPPTTPALIPRITSGSIGAIVTSLVVTPLEVVKVRQQAASTTTNPTVPPSAIKPPSSSSITRAAAAAATTTNIVPCPKGCGTFILNNGLMECVVPKSSVPYFDSHGNYRCGWWNRMMSGDGTMRMMRHIFLMEGWRGIYAGLGPTLVMSVPNTALYYTVYDEIVSRLRQTSNNEVMIPLISGSTSRLIASTLTSPLELIRTRQASAVGSASSPPTMIQEIQSMIRTDGFHSLFRGMGPTLWRDAPFSGVYWMCLEYFKARWKESDIPVWGGAHYHDDEMPQVVKAFHSFVSGASSGMIAAFVTTPFDVVKTRMQMVSKVVGEVSAGEGGGGRGGVGSFVCDHGNAVVYRPPSSSSSAGGGTGTFVTMRQILRSEGVVGLWRGNTARMMKAAPACAIMITCYEAGKALFGDL